MRDLARTTPLRDESPSDRLIVPTNMLAEQAFLGAVLQRNSAADALLGRIKPEHFAEPVHGRIYAAIEIAISNGNSANAITLGPLFDGDRALAERGGRRYLAELQAAVVSTLHAKDYAATIIDCWQRRRIMEIADGARLVASAPHLGQPVADIIRETDDALYQVAEPSVGSGGAVAVITAVDAAIQRTELAYKGDGDPAVVKTGIYDLDRKTGGLFPAELAVLAGRPSMGKTALAGTILRYAAAQFRAEALAGKPPRAVYFHSAEQSRTEIAHRDLADLSDISAERQRRGDLEPAHFNALIEASQTMRDWPYFIDDTPQVGIGYLRHRARRIKRKHGLGLIVVDHLQKLRNGDAENRRLEIGEMTAGLAALSKELHVPVLLLSQLSRAVEQRDDKRPTLADLRESGDIEQDADVVWFIYREAYYLERDDLQQKENERPEAFADRYQRWLDHKAAVASDADLIIAKSRQGQIGKVGLLFQGARSRFTSRNQPGLLDDLP